MNLLYCLRRPCGLYPNGAAVLDGDRRLTWTEFHERVLRSATFLRGIGLDAGDRIAVLALNSPEYLELYFSTAMSGTAIVPLNTRWNIDDVVFSLADSGSRALVVDDRFAPLVAEIRGRVPSIEQIIYAGRSDCPTGMIAYDASVSEIADPRREWTEPACDDIAGLFYTSGTTGGPKGVILTHRNLYSNTVHELVAGVVTGNVYMHAAPMFHLADVAMIHAQTMIGSAHCFVPSFDPEATLATIEKHRVAGTILLPTMINMTLNHSAIDRYDTSSLKMILYGGSPMPLPLLERAIARFGSIFVQAYGMTEASPILTILHKNEHGLENRDAKFTPVKSGGRPVLGVEVRVVDELDSDVGIGEVGEIIARGDNVMKGYWNRPEINAEVMRGGWLHTGDMGAFDDEGFLYILDRKKDMIKTGGENVYSPEVEAALLAHPAILEAAVIGIPDEKWGEAIRAVIALRAGHSLCEEELIAWSRQRMTHFKCPTSVVFLDALPKGGTGKIQKTALRRLVATA